MKTVFTKEEILDGKGCYSEQHVKDLFKRYKSETYTINQILEADIDYDDKIWFVHHNCELTLFELDIIFLMCLKKSLIIMEKCLPNDRRYREYVEMYELCVNKNEVVDITIKNSEMREKYDSAVNSYEEANKLDVFEELNKIYRENNIFTYIQFFNQYKS